MGLRSQRPGGVCQETGGGDDRAPETVCIPLRACRLRELSVTVEAYTASEMMIAAAARALAGVRTVFVGVGLPNIACNLARRTVAPDLELIYEAGVFGARPDRLPLSIGDPTLVTGSLCTTSMADLFGYYLQGGRVEIGFLGGAQVDRWGNLNTTAIFS